ncbi:hypothetical protein [Sharpea azabuensis]|uniref:hypothetical protein n=1 Tax=Sharpea azabuensis TaxID=322505 RepID=UPI002E8204AA|nr:hypothetical protein [Sharpea azabuensis]MEE3309631.1 hypothetical protein [Sharpea azabuensis]
MTQEEKAKAYDEALEKARQFSEHPLQEDSANIVEYIFPELKESEDERIRKEIIVHIRWCEDNGYCAKEEMTRRIDFLEKQNEQKPADKIEPRFKNGQWIVWQNKCYKVNYNGCGYELIDQNGLSTSLEYGTLDASAHLWDITKDAKDGDVLVYKDEISLYKHDINNCTNQETTFGGFVFHCCYDGKRFIMDSLYSLTEQDKMDIQPATKEQRDLLFAKMNEAGYEWDAEKKKLSRRVIDEGKSEMDYCFTKMMNGEKGKSNLE